MLDTDRWSDLPSSTELPCSDETPVDTEGQNLIPNLLLAVLFSLWAHRLDWFFAVDMALYHTAGEDPRVPVVPDALLALSVPRRQTEAGRSSFVIWEEKATPIWVLEMISRTYNQEYSAKMELYAEIGIPYYVIYNPYGLGPRKRRSDPLEVYRLVNGVYQKSSGDPVWMPEIGLGIGQGRVLFGNIDTDCLLWFDREGESYPIPEEARQQAERRAEQAERRAEQAEQQLTQERQLREQEQQRREQAEQRAEQLQQLLRSQGIDPGKL